jgi:hypothetical protein
VACTEHAALKFDSVVGLAVLILLDDDKRDGLNLLVGGETLAALIANTTSANGIVILGRSGINNSCVCVAAKRTFHGYLLERFYFLRKEGISKTI